MKLFLLPKNGLHAGQISQDHSGPYNYPKTKWAFKKCFDVIYKTTQDFRSVLKTLTTSNLICVQALIGKKSQSKSIDLECAGTPGP